MAQIVFSRAEMDRVKGLFDSVKSNGQALAVTDRTISMAEKCKAELSSRGTPYAVQAAKDLSDYLKVATSARAGIAGSPTTAVGKTWTDLKPKVMTIWNYVRVVEMGMPPGEDLGDGFGSAVESAVADLPSTISNAAQVAAVAAKKVVKTATSAVKEVGTAVGGAVGSIAWATLKPLLPLLLVLGAGGAAYFYATKKGLL